MSILSKCVIACLMTIGITIAHGQDDHKAFYAGVTGGAGYYAVIFDPTLPGAAGKISPVFGAAVRFESPKGKAIGLELRYRSGGWTEGDAYERKMSVIEMPVIGHVSFGKGKFKPFITLGETLNYIISQSDELTDPNYDPFFDNKPTNNKWGFALNGGLGVIRPMRTSSIELEIRGTFQVTNMFDPNDEEISETGLSGSLPFFVSAHVTYLFRIDRGSAD